MSGQPAWPQGRGPEKVVASGEMDPAFSFLPLTDRMGAMEQPPLALLPKINSLLSPCAPLRTRVFFKPFYLFLNLSHEMKSPLSPGAFFIRC